MSSSKQRGSESVLAAMESPSEDESPRGSEPRSSTSIPDISEEEMERELEELSIQAVGEDGRSDDAAVNGGFLFSNTEDIKRQRRAAYQFVKTLGKSFLMGKDLVSISLPVELFEPRSFLERLTDNWSYSSVYLNRAAETTDPVERMKNVITFAIAGLHCTCHDAKPFNPILGETYQASYEDGTSILCEQTSHHPPISHWVVTGPNNSFRFTGYGSWAASFRGNSIKGQQSGPNRVEFADGGVVEYELPYLYLHGVLWGDRVLEYGGSVVFRDPVNSLVCELKFDPDKPSLLNRLGSLFSRAKRPPSDLVKGEICVVGTKSNGKEERQPFCRVQGTWLGYLEFQKRPNSDDFERYWDARTARPQKPIPHPNPLPSDSRYREDLQALGEGNLEESQRWKVVLEEKQRRERKLREEFAKRQKRQSSK